MAAISAVARIEVSRTAPGLPGDHAAIGAGTPVRQTPEGEKLTME